MSASAPSTAPVVPVASEDILSAKTDLCISNAIVKAGVGFGAGVVASAILFRRRPWPVLLGLGFGAGQGYADCERVFNPAAVPGFKIQGQENKVAASPFASFNPFSSTPSASTSAPTPAEAKSIVASKVQAVKEKVVEAKDVAVAKAGEVEKKVEKKIDDGKKWV